MHRAQVVGGGAPRRHSLNRGLGVEIKAAAAVVQELGGVLGPVAARVVVL
jgi:hypothetical protein